jgi:hypothetical protein
MCGLIAILFFGGSVLMLMFKRIIFTSISVVVFSLKVPAALLIDNDLSFGKIAVTNNNIVSSVQVSRNGASAAMGNIYILEIGKPGVYTLTEFPPFALVSLSAALPAFSSSTIPGTQQFTLSSVDMPDTINVGADGSAQFKIGGVLQTSGVGGTYISPATYQIDLNIDITY